MPSIFSRRIAGTEKILDEDKPIQCRRLLIINFKTLHERNTRREAEKHRLAAEAKALVESEKVKKREEKLLERGKKAAEERAAKTKLKLANRLAAKEAKQLEKVPKRKGKRPSDSSDPNEDSRLLAKRQKLDIDAEIQSTVENIYDRPRINLRRK